MAGTRPSLSVQNEPPQACCSGDRGHHHESVSTWLATSATTAWTAWLVPEEATGAASRTAAVVPAGPNFKGAASHALWPYQKLARKSLVILCITADVPADDPLEVASYKVGMGIGIHGWNGGI